MAISMSRTFTVRAREEAPSNVPRPASRLPVVRSWIAYQTSPAGMAEAKVAYGKVSIEAREEWMKAEANRRLSEITDVKPTPEPEDVTAELALPKEEPVKEEVKKEKPKKKKKRGWFGR